MPESVKKHNPSETSYNRVQGPPAAPCVGAAGGTSQAQLDSLVYVVTADVSGYYHAMDFGSAFADFQDFLVAVEAFDIVFFHESVSAVELDGVVDAAVSDFGTIQFGHGGVFFI